VSVLPVSVGLDLARQVRALLAERTRLRALIREQHATIEQQAAAIDRLAAAGDPCTLACQVRLMPLALPRVRRWCLTHGRESR
jgi:hypothetical protein